MRVIRVPRRKSALNCIFLICCAGLPLVSGAADDPTSPDTLQAVVVTATKTGATLLQDTPIAIDAYTGANLQSRGVEDLKRLASYSPGIQVADLSGYTQLYIRGIGSDTVFVGSDPSSTVNLDGVYLARPLALLGDFLDIERVEVLEGPQGTLYGRNSVGGTINIISRKPSSQPTEELQAEAGNYGEYAVKGYLSGPVTGSGVLGSLAVVRVAHDAYLQNVSSGGAVESQDDYGVHGQLLFPVAQGSLILRGDYERNNDAMGGYPKLLAPDGNALDDSILGDPFRVSMNLPNISLIENYGFSVDFEDRLSDALRLKSLTAWRGLNGTLDEDADSSSENIFRTLISPIRQHQFSEEIDVNGRWQRLSGVVGAYYFTERDSEPLTLNLPGYGVSNVVRGHVLDHSEALFGQGELALDQHWSLIAGVRYSYEPKHYQVVNQWTASGSLDPVVDEAAATIGAPFVPAPFSISSLHTASALTPKVGVNFKPTRDVLLYLSATRGFKSGGFDYGAPDAADAFKGYAPEYLWSYEAGLKSEWLSHRLRLNLDAFHYDYTNMQVEVFVPPANAVTENAARANINGAEAQIQTLPIPQLLLYVDADYLHARYSAFPNAYVGPFGTFDASGRWLNDAPEWATNIGGTYRLELGNRGTGLAGVDYHWQAREFFSPANGGVGGATGYVQQQGAYGTIGAHVGWDSPEGRWEVMLIGNNLTDKFYVTGTTDYTAAIAGRPGDPRTYRLQVTWRPRPR